MTNLSLASNHQTTKLIRHSLATPVTNLIINLETLINSSDKRLFNWQHHLQQAWLSANYVKSLMSDLDKPQLQQLFALRGALVEVISIIRQPDLQGQLITLFDFNEKLELRGNRFYFQEMLICLINNAFEAYQGKLENRLVILSVKQSSDQLVIQVTDGGCGFHPTQEGEIQRKCQSNNPQGFCPLPKSGIQTTKNNHLGVGLNLVKNVVCTGFRGKLEIKNYPGKGASVICYLPLN